MEVCGERQGATQRPWLALHKEALQGLDKKLEDTRRSYRQAKLDTKGGKRGNKTALDKAKKAFREADKQRKKPLKEWEWTYWEETATEALKSYEKGDMRGVFEAQKKLGMREETRTKNGTKETVADPEKEREAWKTHFESIQKRTEEVADRVWENIPVHTNIAHLMDEEPTDTEIDRAIAGMKSVKAAGADRAKAEYLKYCGSKMRSQIRTVARSMWNKAMQANEGEEGKGWPKAWNVGW